MRSPIEAPTALGPNGVWRQPGRPGPLDGESAPLARPGRGTPPVARRWLGSAILVLGLALTLLGGAYGLYRSYVDWQLSRTVPDGPGSLALPPLPDAPAAAPASPEQGVVAVAPGPGNRILIPRIDLDAPVVELSARVERGKLVWETPAHAVGRYDGTALPAEGGNIVMSGHISSPFRGEGSVFRRLPDLAAGDLVILRRDGEEYRYRVVARDIVRPNAVSVMEPTDREILTLLTCYPDLLYTHRLVVRALPIPRPAD